MRINTRTIAIIVIFASIFILFTFACSTSNKNHTESEATWNETIIASTEPIFMAAATELVTEKWIYPLSQEEIDLIALVTMGEAEGETELGKRLVIDTILNRVDSPYFPNNVTDVIYQPSQFSVMWNGRLDRCYVMPEIVELVKEELMDRTNYNCIFFTSEGYSKYGDPMFKECCHYFSSYK